MKQIIELQDIYVPSPGPEEVYATTLLDRQFHFKGLKALLGAADISKAGDRTTDLAAEDEMAREAARSILSNLSLQHIYDNPLTDENGRVDTVMRAGYEIDCELFKEIASMTVGNLKITSWPQREAKSNGLAKRLHRSWCQALSKSATYTK